MIYVFSNRNLINNETWLGDNFNASGNDNLRVARYLPSSNSVASATLDFYDEIDGELLPSIQVFNEVELSDKPCCIFIHGFNQSLEKNMKKCEEIESYGVNVIAFSWPSNPGPQQWYRKLKEYKIARENARRSTIALERFFNKLNDYRIEKIEFKNIKSMMVHSLGNYLFQSFVSGLGYENQTAFLTNILLHQADADNHDHEKWINLLTSNNTSKSNNTHVMVTINESDDVLDISDLLNPDRLGNTLDNLTSQFITYINFGQLPEAKNKHKLWVNEVVVNDNAKHFFQSVFKGNEVETEHLVFDKNKNCFHIT